MARRKSRRSPGDLPQYEETWHVIAQQLRVWITPPDEEPYRPFVILVMNLNQDLILNSTITQDTPTSDQIIEILLHAMRSPQGPGQKRHRPTQVNVETTAHLTGLKSDLENIGVEVALTKRPEFVEEMIIGLESHLRGGPELSGLLAGEGVTAELVGDLFSAAAEFYLAEPWIHLTDQQTLAIQVAPAKEPRFVQVMGGGGVEYGLATYRRWEDVERMFTFADHPLEILPPDGGHSFLFHDKTMVPFDDLAAIERYGWPIADEQAIPTPLIFTREGEARRPEKDDLVWYEAALRAIPIFVRNHLDDEPDPDQPLGIEFTLQTHYGDRAIYIKYPAGVLPTDTRPVDLAEWPDYGDEDDEDDFPVFDRRAMEGIMRMFAPDHDDPALQQAQDLMYRAWEETNPAQRLILAHEALAISADCADAYVLLAEEEADTLGRALEYYRQGMEAGERALGKGFFEENVGHFWGLMETRPYMRARYGLANILWELGRGEESVAHFQDMLCLNPGDNQGIRYSLLNLLLSLNRDAEAQDLLQQYEDDGGAEWLYTRALMAFREAGASRTANELLR